MNTLTLSQADAHRLERLANEAGRSPQDILKHVLRDGFDATEYAIKIVKHACEASSESRMKTQCSNSIA